VNEVVVEEYVIWSVYNLAAKHIQDRKRECLSQCTRILLTSL